MRSAQVRGSRHGLNLKPKLFTNLKAPQMTNPLILVFNDPLTYWFTGMKSNNPQNPPKYKYRSNFICISYIHKSQFVFIYCISTLDDHSKRFTVQFLHSPRHTHSYSASISSTLLFYEVEHLAQGHFVKI